MGEIRDVPQSSMADILGILLDVPEKADVLVCDITKRISIKRKSLSGSGEVVDTLTYDEHDAMCEAGLSASRTARFNFVGLHGVIPICPIPPRPKMRIEKLCVEPIEPWARE